MTGECYVLKAFMVECGSILLSNTNERHLNQYSIDILIGARLTLDQQWINSRSIVGEVLTNPYHRPMYWLKISWLSARMSMECQLRWWWSVNWVIVVGIVQGYRSRWMTFSTDNLYTVCWCQWWQLSNFCEIFSCQIEDVEKNIRGCENELDMIDRSLRLKKMSDGER